MEEFDRSGKLTIEGELLKNAQNDFVSARVGDEEIVRTIRDFHQQTGYLLDPHTAVGVKAAEKTDLQTPSFVWLAHIRRNLVKPSGKHWVLNRNFRRS